MGNCGCNNCQKVKNDDSGLRMVRFQLEPKAGWREMGGESFIVADTVPIVEGVLNGIYVPRERILESTLRWNGKPITMGHPEIDGMFHSANNPEMASLFWLGHFFSASMPPDSDRLLGEMWFRSSSMARFGEAGEQLAIDLLEGNTTEVSTGFFADLEEASGTFQGESYLFQSGYIDPDHIAILRDEVGACSVADGCGVPRTNQLTLLNNFSASEEDYSTEESMTNTTGTVLPNSEDEEGNVTPDTGVTDPLLEEEDGQEEDPVTPEQEDDMGDSVVEVLAQVQNSLQSLGSTIANMPTLSEEHVAVLDSLVSQQKMNRDSKIESIVANSDYTAEELASSPDSLLDKLFSNISASRNSLSTNFQMGRGGFNIASAQDSEWEDYVSPRDRQEGE